MNSQQQSIPNGGVNMDVLEGLMSMQERGGQSVVAAGVQQPPQMLMEQQMRLNQLQQLYQLQTQIFQQQVSTFVVGSACPFHDRLRGYIAGTHSVYGAD